MMEPTDLEGDVPPEFKETLAKMLNDLDFEKWCGKINRELLYKTYILGEEITFKETKAYEDFKCFVKQKFA